MTTCRHAWMQKHPTPSHAGRDFHWHPADTPTEVRNALAELIGRAGKPPAAVWLVTDEHVAWARAFAAVAPVDRRRYTGIAATIASRGGSDPAALLAALPLPEARPYRRGDATEGPHRPRPAGRLAPVAAPLARLSPDAAGLAAALLADGAVRVPDPTAAGWPALVGALLTWLPAQERHRPRRGGLTSTATTTPTRDEATANLVHYLALAWMCPSAIRRRDAGYGARAWSLVLDLAATRGGLRPLFVELTRLAAAWDTAEHLERYLVDSGTVPRDVLVRCDRRAPAPVRSEAALDAGVLWNRLLHYWGRGLLEDDHLVDRLADTLSARVTADHLFHLDRPEAADLPARYLRRLRYEAMLPAERTRALLNAVTRRVPALRPGGVHA